VTRLTRDGAGKDGREKNMNSDLFSMRAPRSIAIFWIAFAGISLAGAAAKARPAEPLGANGKTAPRMAQRKTKSEKSGAGRGQLLRLVGEYTRVVKFLGQSGAAARPSYGASKFSPLLGGKFVLETSHDVVFGKPVDGLRIYGYDPATKQYQMARMYTMSPAITLLQGASRDGGKTIVYSGEAAGSGAASMPLRATLRWLSNDEFTVTMSTRSATGKDMPFQETIYTRKK